MADLEASIQQMIDYIYQLTPEVQVKFNPRIYEDEQANLSVYPPLAWDDERCLDLQEKIGDRVIEMLLDTGWLISVYVYMPEQQIAEAQREQELVEKTLKVIEQRREAAEHVLSQAKSLGLLQTEAG